LAGKEISSPFVLLTVVGRDGTDKLLRALSTVRHVVVAKPREQGRVRASCRRRASKDASPQSLRHVEALALAKAIVGLGKA
jgi:hypothetical protein